MPLHRNSQKRIYIPDAAYFVTVKTRHNEPYFRESLFCDLFIEQLRIAKRLKEFELYGWFLGCDHFHLVIRPGDRFNYSKIMQFLKRHFTRNANVVMGHTTEGAIGQSRLHGEYVDHERPISHFALWVIRARIQFILKYDHREPFPLFRWQKSFHDHYCRNEIDFRNHLEYIAGNPMKHGLPLDWPYIFTNPKYTDLTNDGGF